MHKLDAPCPHREAAVCHPCRRAMRATTCAGCGAPCERSKYMGRINSYCSKECFGHNQPRIFVRSPDDPQRTRYEREFAAPGLSRGKRNALLKTWQTRGRTCAYCTRKPTTVDHVVPLVRGGTNYEGNLVPCCRSCNSSKSGHLIIEWRTGKRLPQLTTVMQRDKPKREAKAKAIQPAKPASTCYICGDEYTMTRVNRVTCGEAHCQAEHVRRRTRDVYRAQHGIAVDKNEPTIYWRAIPRKNTESYRGTRRFSGITHAK